MVYCGECVKRRKKYVKKSYWRCCVAFIDSDIQKAIDILLAKYFDFKTHVVNLTINWKNLGLNANRVNIVAPFIKDFQKKI